MLIFILDTNTFDKSILLQMYILFCWDKNCRKETINAVDRYSDFIFQMFYIIYSQGNSYCEQTINENEKRMHIF